MKNKKTYYQIILDRSGSMSDCIDVTISGFNEQLQLIKKMKQKFPEQEFVISLATFNQEVQPILQMVNPNEAQLLNRETYVPDGMTALYDAIGQSVMKLKDVAGKEIDNDEATAVVVIITDGHENSSRFFNYAGISKLIKELDAQKNWTFSYLGATIDAVKIAESLNVRTANSVSFEKASSSRTWKRLAQSKMRYYAKKSAGVVSDEMIIDEKDMD